MLKKFFENMVVGFTGVILILTPIVGTMFVAIYLKLTWVSIALTAIYGVVGLLALVVLITLLYYVGSAINHTLISIGNSMRR